MLKVMLDVKKCSVDGAFLTTAQMQNFYMLESLQMIKCFIDFFTQKSNGEANVRRK
jgi:hypothetical protein